ncbi:LIM domain protein, partial [Teladorsagia circumcincta]
RYGQRCAGCDGALEKEDLVRKARDKVFHIQCFQCSVCQRRLDTGEQRFERESCTFWKAIDSSANKTFKTQRKVRHRRPHQTDQVWFQNRRSKERRMKQLRFGGFRPTRRSRGGRDELCQEMFQNEGPPPGFFNQHPIGFFCDPYGERGPLPPLPAFPVGTDAPHPLVHEAMGKISAMRQELSLG